MINFWIAPRSIFDRFWAPTWGVQGGPWGVRRATFWALEAVLEPPRAGQPPTGERAGAVEGGRGEA